jgi:hypothetical protein
LDRETGQTGDDYAEENDEDDIPGETGVIPILRDPSNNEGTSSSLSSHVYPNPPIIMIQTPEILRQNSKLSIIA